MVRILIMKDNTTLMALLGTTFLTWRRALQQRYLASGVTLKQLYLLRQLRQREFLYPADIARMLFCDRPTATVVIANMEKKQWLLREKDPDNGRRVRVRLTPEGQAKLAGLDAAKAEQRDEFDPEACFTDAELGQLIGLLKRLENHLSPLGSVDPAELGED